MQFEKFYSPNYQVQKNGQLIYLHQHWFIDCFFGDYYLFHYECASCSKHSFKPSHFNRIYYRNCDKHWFRRSPDLAVLQNSLRNYYEQTEQKSRAIAKNRTRTINNKKPSALLKVFFIIILFSISRLEY